MSALLAQISVPGAEHALESASQEGWLAVLVTIIVLSFIAATVFLARLVIRQADKRETEALERETRMADRIDAMENREREREQQYSDEMRTLTEKVTEALVHAREAQDSMRQALTALTTTMGDVNGDIKSLCQLMRVCPCLLMGKSRGRYKLVDEDGAEVDLTQFDATP